jgi:hypothetical protein
VYTGSVYWSIPNFDRKIRIVFQVIVRTCRADGQMTLRPEIGVQTWWTSLKYSEKTVIKLYLDHGTSEQFHSEVKTDMDLERFPSGKFETNSLILQLAILAYNILRLMRRKKA